MKIGKFIGLFALLLIFSRYSLVMPSEEFVPSGSDKAEVSEAVFSLLPEGLDWTPPSGDELFPGEVPGSEVSGSISKGSPFLLCS